MQNAARDEILTGSDKLEDGQDESPGGEPDTMLSTEENVGLQQSRMKSKGRLGKWANSASAVSISVSSSSMGSNWHEDADEEVLESDLVAMGSGENGVGGTALRASIATDGKKKKKGSSYHKNPLVREALRASVSSENPFAALVELDWVRVLPEVDADGFPIILIIGNNFRVKKMDRYVALLFFLFVLHNAAFVEHLPYTLIYVHTHASVLHSTGLMWLLRMYRRLPARAFRLLNKVIVLHPTIHLRLGLWSSLPVLGWHVWRRVRFADSMDELYIDGHMERDAVLSIKWPEVCAQHEKEQSERAKRAVRVATGQQSPLEEPSIPPVDGEESAS